MCVGALAQLLCQRRRQLAGEGHQAGGGVQSALRLAVGQGGRFLGKTAGHAGPFALALELAFELADEVGLLEAHGGLGLGVDHHHRDFGNSGQALAETTIGVAETEFIK